GDASRGLGTNHYSIEPALLYYRRFTGRLGLESQLMFWHPIGGSAGDPTARSEGYAGDIFSYGIGPSYEVYRGERVGFTPVIELVGWRILNGFRTIPGPAVEVSG